MVIAEIFGPDMLVILAILLLVFGGAKIPKLARSLGAAKGEFEKGLHEGQTQITTSSAPETPMISNGLG